MREGGDPDALRALGDRLRSDADLRYDLTGATIDSADFSGITLDDSGELLFTGARFTGAVSFAGSSFGRCKVSFDQAKVDRGAVISFDQAEFDTFGVTFRRMTLAGELTFDGARVHRGRIPFDDAGLDSGLLSFADAEFDDGDVSFHRCFLLSPRLVFDRARSTGNGSGPTFDYATLDAPDISLRDMHVDGATISFRGARFIAPTVRLDNSTFTGDAAVVAVDAIIEGGRTSFAGATFTDAAELDLSFTDLSGGLIDFTGTRFAGRLATFRGAEFKGSALHFQDTRFDSGEISFEDIYQHDGAVDFPGALFRGSKVTVSPAVYEAGTFDLSHPGDWSVPPTIEAPKHVGPLPT